MRTGLTVSAIIHLVLIGWGAISLSAFEPLDASSIEAVPVEFIEVDAESSTPLGLKDAKPDKDPAPNDPSELVAKAPAPAPDPPAEEPTPPTPPPPPPSPDPEPMPDPAALEPPPVDQAEPTPEPPPEQAVPEPDPTAEEQPPPDQTTAPEPKEVAVETPLPRVRPPRPAPAPPTETKEFADEITALLDKSKAASAPAPSDKQATIGAVTGSPFTQLRQNEIDALRARLAACWDIPPTRVDPAELRVKVKVFLSQDGTISREPEVVEYRPSQIGQVAAESAVRAVKRCAPYTLPVAKYESWKEIIMTFDPREMFGG